MSVGPGEEIVNVDWTTSRGGVQAIVGDPLELLGEYFDDGTRPVAVTLRRQGDSVALACASAATLDQSNVDDAT